MSAPQFGLLSAIVDEFTAKLANPDVSVGIGRDFLSRNARPPRIAFVPDSASYGPAPRVGGNPRPLYARNLSVSVHIWGASFAATEELLLDTVVALRGIASGPQMQLGGEQWLAQQGEAVKHGDAAELALTIETLVYDRAKTTAAVEAVDVSPCGEEEDGET